MRKCKGFTLVELMVSVTILAILTIIVIPNFTEFIIKIRVDNEISQLQRLLLVARNSAINYNQNITVCPLDDQLQCTSDWRGAISVFIDRNNNDRLDTNINETIIRIKEAIKLGDKLQYGLRRFRLKYAPTGRTTGFGSNGTFKYCPKNYEQYSRAIIVSTSGRIYLSSDIDKDGKDETRSGSEIVCRD